MASTSLALTSGHQAGPRCGAVRRGLYGGGSCLSRQTFPVDSASSICPARRQGPGTVKAWPDFRADSQEGRRHPQHGPRAGRADLQGCTSCLWIPRRRPMLSFSPQAETHGKSAGLWCQGLFASGGLKLILRQPTVQKIEGEFDHLLRLVGSCCADRNHVLVANGVPDEREAHRRH